MIEAVNEESIVGSEELESLIHPVTKGPEQRLANELAHLRAKRYLAQADDLF